MSVLSCLMITGLVSQLLVVAQVCPRRGLPEQHCTLDKHKTSRLGISSKDLKTNVKGRTAQDAATGPLALAMQRLEVYTDLSRECPILTERLTEDEVYRSMFLERT